MARKKSPQNAPQHQPAQHSAERALSEIKDRAQGDTRPLNLEHLFTTARSINTVGLIEPIVIDRENHLIAGGHRLMAFRLLNPETREAAIQRIIHQHRQLSGSEGVERTLQQLRQLFEDFPERPSVDCSRIPVRVVDIDSQAEPNRALEIEIAENTIRRDYAPAEVMSIY